MFYGAIDDERDERRDAFLDEVTDGFAELRERLMAQVRRRPEDAGLVMRALSALVRAALAEQRLSPRARKDLADNLASVLNSLGDQLMPVGWSVVGTQRPGDRSDVPLADHLR